MLKNYKTVVCSLQKLFHFSGGQKIAAKLTHALNKATTSVHRLVTAANKCQNGNGVVTFDEVKDPLGEFYSIIPQERRIPYQLQRK